MLYEKCANFLNDQELLQIIEIGSYYCSDFFSRGEYRKERQIASHRSLREEPGFRKSSVKMNEMLGND